MCSVERWQCPQLWVPPTTPFSAFCTAIHSLVTGAPREFKFGVVPLCQWKIIPKGAWSGSPDRFYTQWNISGTAKARDFQFFLMGWPCEVLVIYDDWLPLKRGQSHVNNFYILDLENFATASPWCIGVINNVVSSLLVDSYYSRARCGWMQKFIIRWSTVTL